MKGLFITAFLIGTPSAALSQQTCSTPADPFLNPFSADSAHHKPLGTSARFAGDNHASTRDWLQANRFNINTGTTPWGLYMTEAGANGRTLRVNTRPNTTGSRLPADVRFPPGGVTIDFPDNRDGNIAIFDRTRGVFQHLRQYRWNNGSPQAGQFRVYDWNSLGHGTSIGQRIGTSASGVAAPFGILRGFEINTPGHRIEHALQMGLPARPTMSGSSCNVMLSRDIILPATSRDGFASNMNNNNGNIPYGALMALPPNVNINSLGLSEPGRRLAAAIQNYGVYVIDEAGCGNGAMRADQDVTPQVLQALRNDIPKIYRHMRMVLNSEWRRGQAATGGGQPVAPNCAIGAGASQNSVSAPSSSPAASTPESAQADSTSPSQSQAASGGSASSAGGTVSWAAVPRANNYLVEVWDTTGRRERVYGRMSPPQDSGCVNGGTCRHIVPPLPAGRSYEWRFRANVNGQAQPFSAWQPFNQSSAAAPAGNQGSSSTASAAQSQPSAGSSSSGGTVRLTWSAVPGAGNYLVEVWTASGRREKVYGRMSPPQDSGCANGGTCAHVVPSLPAGQSYQWRFRANVNGQPQPFSDWRPVGQSAASAPAGNDGSSTVASAAQSQPSAASRESDGTVRLSWAAVPRANNYYVEVSDTSARQLRVYRRMAPPRASGCVNGGTCEHVVPSLPAGGSYQWNWRPIVDGEPKPFRGWRPIR